MRAFFFVLSSLALLSGCPSTAEPTDAGTDAPSNMDVPERDGATEDGATPLDTPAGEDVPALLDASVVDAPVTDAPPLPDAPTECDGLAAAACLRAGCVAAFDDTCCPECPSTGACADCTNIDYLACQPTRASACEGSSGCGVAPAWACGGGAPSCDDAHVIDVDSCDRVGCVPAYPSGEGGPNPGLAVCVAITGDSCTVSCRRLPPPCPTGTVPEGDGFCYTDRCVPAFVCID